MDVEIPARWGETSIVRYVARQLRTPNDITVAFSGSIKKAKLDRVVERVNLRPLEEGGARVSNSEPGHDGCWVIVAYRAAT